MKTHFLPILFALIVSFLVLFGFAALTEGNVPRIVFYIACGAIIYSFRKLVSWFRRVLNQDEMPNTKND